MLISPLPPSPARAASERPKQERGWVRTRFGVEWSGLLEWSGMEWSGVEWS